MRIDFYHLTRTPIERALPRLLEKALGAGHRLVVMAPGASRVEQLDKLLWEYDPDSFLPHGSARYGHAAAQPVYLTDAEERPNAADVLILTDGMTPDFLSEFTRVIDLFDGRDAGQVTQARSRWKRYQAAGHTLSYLQQTERGGWEKKAGA